MNIYDNNKELLSTLGVEGNYSTDFEVRKAILNALGGDASICNSIYEVDLQILKIYQEGGGGGSGSETIKLADGTKLSYSLWSTVPEYYSFEDISDFSRMFKECYNLTSLPLIDTSKGTTFERMFYDCDSLSTIPELNTSSGVDFIYMFSHSKIKTVPPLDTSNGENFMFMFENCSVLNTIERLNFSKATSLIGVFNSCKLLSSITLEGCINVSISFPFHTSVTKGKVPTDETVKSILTAASNTTNTDSKTLGFGTVVKTDQNGELAALVADCTSKGWTISGLTLN